MTTSAAVRFDAELAAVGQALERLAAATGRTAAFVELMRRYNRKLYQAGRAILGADCETEEDIEEEGEEE